MYISGVDNLFKGHGDGISISYIDVMMWQQTQEM